MGLLSERLVFWYCLLVELSGNMLDIAYVLINFMTYET